MRTASACAAPRTDSRVDGRAGQCPLAKVIAATPATIATRAGNARRARRFASSNASAHHAGDGGPRNGAGAQRMEPVSVRLQR